MPERKGRSMDPYQAPCSLIMGSEQTPRAAPALGTGPVFPGAAVRTSHDSLTVLETGV